MPRDARTFLFAMLLAAAVFALASKAGLAGQSAPAPRKAASGLPLVFLVHSYDADYAWSRGIGEGAAQALRGHAELRTLHLDVKGSLNAGPVQQRVETILAQIDDARPKAVIAADDAAQELLVVPYLKGRASPQVIFCGVNAPLARYGYPARNVSGVRSVWHFRQSFGLLHAIVPRARRAVFLTDASESSDHIVRDLATELRRGGPFGPLRVQPVRPATFQQWQRAVRSAQTGADALALGIYHALRDERTGETVSPEEVMNWTNAANRLPTVGFADYAIRHGQLCGVLGSAREQGGLAGEMVRQTLERGVEAGRLRVRENRKGIVLVNIRTAERLGVSIPYALIEAAEVVIQ